MWFAIACGWVLVCCVGLLFVFVGFNVIFVIVLLWFGVCGLGLLALACCFVV